MTEGKCHCPWSHRLCEKTDIHLAFYIIHIIRHSILTFYQAFFLVSIARVRARACPNWAGAPDRVRVRRSPDYRGACERSPVCPNCCGARRELLEQVCFTASWHLLRDLGPLVPTVQGEGMRSSESVSGWGKELHLFKILETLTWQVGNKWTARNPQISNSDWSFQTVQIGTQKHANRLRITPGQVAWSHKDINW